MYLVRKILVEMVKYLIINNFSKKFVKSYCLTLKNVLFDENTGNINYII